MKGYKVTDRSRTKTCGIACSNLKELRIKSCSKFEIVNEERIFFYLLDGTIVDTEEYFSTLEPQTLLIFTDKVEEIITGADVMYNALKSVNIDLLRAGDDIKQFFDDNLKEKVKVLSELLIKHGDTVDKTVKSSRKDHPEWFEGLETRSRNKEEYLNRRCRDRIRGYFYKAKFGLKAIYNEPSKRVIVESLTNGLKLLLEKESYMGVYFDRSEEGRLCDQEGCFTCDGVWSASRCNYLGGNGHTINPYMSREERIIFSTWNLDHRIEKSRTIMPGVMEAVNRVAKDRTLVLNIDLIFALLFTTKNLRLVHIICHDKAVHSTATLSLHDILLPRAINGLPFQRNSPLPPQIDKKKSLT